MAAVEQWGEWEEEIVEEKSSKRSEKEERRLWRMLEESDKEQAKELERKAKKAARKVNQARTRMGTGKSQPGIGDIFKSAKVKANLSMTVQESRVVTSIEESSQGGAAHSLEPNNQEDEAAHSLVEGDVRQGAQSLEDVQGDVHKVGEQQAAHGLEDEVQDDVQPVV